MMMMTMMMSLLMMIDDDDVDAWETDTRRHHYLPWESLRPQSLTFFFSRQTLDENHLRMTPSVFFDRLFNRL